MTGQDRHDALLNIKIVLSIAQGYIGITSTLKRPLTPQQMDDILAKAAKDLDAVYTEAALPGEDIPRPEGTKITGIDNDDSEPLVVSEGPK